MRHTQKPPQVRELDHSLVAPGVTDRLESCCVGVQGRLPAKVCVEDPRALREVALPNQVNETRYRLALIDRVRNDALRSCEVLNGIYCSWPRNPVNSVVPAIKEDDLVGPKLAT